MPYISNDDYAKTQMRLERLEREAGLNHSARYIVGTVDSRGNKWPCREGLTEEQANDWMDISKEGGGKPYKERQY